MTAAMAMPSNTAETFLVHFFGAGLADDRYVVERYRADGDIVPAPVEALAAKGRPKIKRATVTLKAVKELRPTTCRRRRDRILRFKSTLHAGRYASMRKGIVAHETCIDDTNVAQPGDFDTVSRQNDSQPARRPLPYDQFHDHVRFPWSRLIWLRPKPASASFWTRSRRGRR